MNTQTIRVPHANLSLQEQLTLGKRMSDGDTTAREKLVMACVPLVNSFARTQLCRHFSSRDDIFQDGMLGALEAVDKYDYRKNVMFTTFAFPHIHKRIVYGIIGAAPVKISDRDYFNSVLINSTIEAYTSVHFVPPTDEQLAALTSIPLKNIRLFKTRNVDNMVISLNGNIPVAEMFPLPEEDVAIVVEKVLKESAQKRVIAEALRCLSDEEREIILRRVMRKENKATLMQLAESQGVSFPTIAKREKAALRKLLAHFISHNVDFDDLVY